MAKLKLFLLSESGRQLTVGAKFEVNVKKWDRGSSFCCLFYIIWIKL